MNNEKDDKLTEWIKRTIEQGDDKPLQISSIQPLPSQASNQTHKQKKQFKHINFNEHKNMNKSVGQRPREFSRNQSQNQNRSGHPQQSRYPKQQGRPQQSGHPQQQGRPQQSSHSQQPIHQQKFQKSRVGHPQASAHPQRPRTAQAGRNIRPKRAPAQKLKALPPFKGLRIIPIGGLNEIGKNMTAYEYNRTGHPQDKEIIVIDMGLQFPEEDMLGVDYVIPDSTYLEENQKKIKAIIITHGHLDHIGGIPYILPKIGFPPVYATKLTRGLIEGRIEEFKLEKFAKLHTINPKEDLIFGSFRLSFFRVAHSIPDSVGIVVSTPEGKIVHTGDFKFDDSPAGIQEKADIDKINALGSQNVLALLSDSTNALKPGHTMSEQDIGNNLERLITAAKGRVIIASFSSLIGRIQQIFEYAEKTGRKIYVSGRSMKQNIDLALNLGYLKIHTNLMRDIKKVEKAPDNEILIITTGSQGEAVSALTRMAINDHAQVHIKKGDTVIVSSTPILGNERSIYTVINNLSMMGAKVIHHQISAIHTSGHGYQEELKQMIQMVRPKYFAPVHGEYFMRNAHKDLAIECGIHESNCILIQNGDILEIARPSSNQEPVVRVGHEKVEAKYILIDGLGEGTIGSQVMMERQKMSLNGILAIILTVEAKNKRLVEDPNIFSRGFIYMHEYEEITAELGQLVGDAYKQFIRKKPDADRKEVKRFVISIAEKYTHQKLERRPLILPLVFEK